MHYTILYYSILMCNVCIIFYSCRHQINCHREMTHLNSCSMHALQLKIVGLGRLVFRIMCVCVRGVKLPNGQWHAVGVCIWTREDANETPYVNYECIWQSINESTILNAGWDLSLLRKQHDTVLQFHRISYAMGICEVVDVAATTSPVEPKVYTLWCSSMWSCAHVHTWPVMRPTLMPMPA